MSIGVMSMIAKADYDLTELEHLDLSGSYLEELTSEHNKY